MYDDLLKNDNETNLEHAFRIAQDHLNIDRLLEPEGMKEGVISLDTTHVDVSGLGLKLM